MTIATADRAEILPPRQRWSGSDVFKLFGRIGVSIALFAAALRWSPELPAWRDLAGIGIGSIAVCCLLAIGTVVLLAWRWRYIVSSTVAMVSVPSLAAFAGFTWTGLAVNQLLPSVIGGDMLRATLLSHRGVPAMAAAGTVIVDRLYGMAGLLVLCLAGAPLLNLAMFNSMIIGSTVMGLFLLSVAVAIWAAGQWSDRLRPIWRPLVSSLSRRNVSILILAAIGGHLANIAVFLVIAHALGADLAIFPTVGVLSAILLVSALPISIAGWGVREFVLMQAFGNSSLDPDKIVLSSIAYGLFLLLAQATGFLMILRGR